MTRKFETFVITKDHLDGDSMAENDVEHLKNEGFTEHFKLYDDDDVLYYSGYLHKDCEDELDPLDWAMYDSGCTRIDYRNKDGKYETV
jgi:hypothetical protein